MCSLVRIGFVGNYKNWFFRATQYIGKFLIQTGKAGININHKQNYGCLVHGQFYLLPDLFFENIVGAMYIATRIDYGKILANPFAMAIMPVTGYAAYIVHDGFFR